MNSLTRCTGLGVALCILFASCVLFEDGPCQTDADCNEHWGCYKKAQCLPKTWIAKTNRLLEGSPEVPETLEKSTEVSPLGERKESLFDASDSAPEEIQTKDSIMPPERPIESATCTKSCQLGETRDCYPLQQKGCSQIGGIWKCEGICGVGSQRCSITQQGQKCPDWGECSNPKIPAPKEVCDQLDNNCNGQVDEDCDCKGTEKQACYTKGGGCKKIGSTFQCQSPCITGTQTCANGKWGTCEGEQGPQVEVCDGKDNDCDGKTDETFPTQNQNCTEPQRKGICEAGKWDCLKGIATCVANLQPKTEICANNADDDCDGKTDEGCVSDFAGICGTKGYKDTMRLQAMFNFPAGIVSNKAGELYIADYGNHCIRQVDTAGNVTRLAGICQTQGDKNGLATQALFRSPLSLAIHPSGTLYIADGNSFERIRWLNAAKTTVSHFTGSTNGMSGNQDGPASNSLFTGIFAIAFDPLSNQTLWVTESDNAQLRKVDSAGAAQVVGKGMFADDLSGITFGQSGDMFIAESGNCIKKAERSGKVTVFAGNCSISGTRDGAGTNARLDRPKGMASNALGDLFVSDADSCFRKIDPQGTVTTLAGVCGKTGHKNGPLRQSLFSSTAHRLTFNNQGHLLVADTDNHCIRKIVFE